MKENNAAISHSFLKSDRFTDQTDSGIACISHYIIKFNFPEDSGGDVSISSVESVHSFTVRAIVYDLLT